MCKVCKEKFQPDRMMQPCCSVKCALDLVKINNAKKQRKEDAKASVKYDVTGSLCENNDKFAIDRMLPEMEADDIVVIHDAGAHGHSMGFNYNGKLRPKELLLCANGTIKLIRRQESEEDYFRTLSFEPDVLTL